MLLNIFSFCVTGNSMYKIVELSITVAVLTKLHEKDTNIYIIICFPNSGHESPYMFKTLQL